jgi:hypothetical protein
MHPRMATALPLDHPWLPAINLIFPGPHRRHKDRPTCPKAPMIDRASRIGTLIGYPSACNDAYPIQPLPSHYIYTRETCNLDAINKNKLAFTFFVDFRDGLIHIQFIETNFSKETQHASQANCLGLAGSRSDRGGISGRSGSPRRDRQADRVIPGGRHRLRGARCKRAPST